MDLSLPTVRQYVTGICVELADMGFDEIVLDNSGWPTTGRLDHIRGGDDPSADRLTAPVEAFYQEVREALKEKGYSVSLINARFVKPIDEEAVREACAEHRLIVTMDENVACGGYGEKVLSFLNRNGFLNLYLNISIPDAYVEHGNVELLKKEIGIDADSVVERIQQTLVP